MIIILCKLSLNHQKQQQQQQEYQEIERENAIKTSLIIYFNEISLT